MTCGLSIATSSGLHLRCMIEGDEKGQHEGDCIPRIPDCVPRRQLLPIPDVTMLHESRFLAHLLNIVEAAIATPAAPPLFTPAEAINLCRSLIWQRVGRESPF